MIQPNFQWNGVQATQEITNAGWDAVRRCTLYFWNALQLAINIPYPPASKPGDPPHKRTGYLAANVQYELDKPNLTGKVGITANAKYGLFLEFGTKRMAARPFVMATLRKVWGQLVAMAGP